MWKGKNGRKGCQIKCSLRKREVKKQKTKHRKVSEKEMF